MGGPVFLGLVNAGVIHGRESLGMDLDAIMLKEVARVGYAEILYYLAGLLVAESGAANSEVHNLGRAERPGSCCGQAF